MDDARNPSANAFYRKRWCASDARSSGDKVKRSATAVWGP